MPFFISGYFLSSFVEGKPQFPMQDDLKLALKVYSKAKFSRLILSGGMARSGSTLLYNIVRLCLVEKYSDNISSGWIGDITDIESNKVNLLKTHEFHPVLALRAKYIFSTYRDIRQILVSSHIKFNAPLTIDRCRKYVYQYEQFKKCSDLMFSYEEIVYDTERQIVRIADKLKLEINPQCIIDNLPKIKSERCRSTGYDKITQMHGGHSSGIDPDEWKIMLPNQLQEQIREEFDYWFEETGYK